MQGECPGADPGGKPPEAIDISHFLRPENGLGSFNFSS